MNVTVKSTEPSDIEAIFALRRDPAVLAEQYKPGWFDTPNSFTRKIDGKPNWLGISFACSSIFADGALVGHVMQHFGPGPDGIERSCDCGWNLCQTHWGQGIMPRALRTLFHDLFEKDPELAIYAACFSTNHRCRRVIEKLGFQPTGMYLAERLIHWASSRGRRVEQFRLNRSGLAQCTPP